MNNCPKGICYQETQVLSPIKSSSMGLSFEMLSFRFVSRTSFRLSCFSLHTYTLVLIDSLGDLHTLCARKVLWWVGGGGGRAYQI